MSDFIAGIVVACALAPFAWGLSIYAGSVLWHAALGVHRLLAGM